jgi:hypothetical protein
MPIRVMTKNENGRLSGCKYFQITYHYFRRRRIYDEF